MPAPGPAPPPPAPRRREPAMVGQWHAAQGALCGCPELGGGRRSVMPAAVRPPPRGPGRPGGGSAQRAIAAFATSCLLLGAAGAKVGVVEGDTKFQVFVNSVYMAPDRLSLPVLPMNGVRRFPVYGAPTEVIPVRGNLNAGDILAIKVESNRPYMVNWTDVTGKSEMIPGLAGLIAAFDDGTMTSTEWRCSETAEYQNDRIWHHPRYNDSTWAYAVEQPIGCCPWRDEERSWRGLAARWIGPLSANISGPRIFYCRYLVPDSRRLPRVFLNLASPDAPRVTMVSFVASVSQIMVKFSVDQPAYVSCAVIDARFKLRPPIHAELLQQGVNTSGLVQANGSVWKFLGSISTPFDYSNGTLSYHSVSSILRCQEVCDANPFCKGITFYEVGMDLRTGGNCKLVTGFDMNRTLTASSVHRYTHKYTESVPIVHFLVLTGMLLPGTIYDTYCTARGVDGLHSTWQTIADFQHLSNRTAGCLDCGDTTPPVVTMLGGWAGTQDLTTVVVCNKAGRIFCGAVAAPAAADALTVANIKAQFNSNFLTQAFSSVPVTMTGLSPATEYEVACLAEADGGVESTPEIIEATHRHWFTESKMVTIVTMSIRPVVQPKDSLLSINLFVQLSTVGMLWCRELLSNYTRYQGIPQGSWLRANGIVTVVKDVAQEMPGNFPGLNPNVSHEVYCTAEENLNVSLPETATSPFPVATILDPVVANYDSIQVVAKVDEGPSRIFCSAVLWSYTNEQEPPAPGQAEMILSPYTVNVMSDLGGVAKFEIIVPYIGSFYDVYCYAEEFMDLPPAGSASPPRRGMNSEAIRKTKRFVQTLGASHKNDGWLCVSGLPCNITDSRGPPIQPLRKTHRILARERPCAGQCFCNGQEDFSRKGAFCSPVSQDPRVPAPFRASPDDVELPDPRGSWCYVHKGVCPDEETSPTYPYLWISYEACAFNLTAGREGSGPPGFPREGLAQVVGSTGRTFSWGSADVLALGAAYYLCWCDNQNSPCSLGVDYRLSLGRLHLAGPSQSQAGTNSECIAGLPCGLRHFNGHSLEDGSRLVVLPETRRGCHWQKEYPLDPPGVVGFPLDGVSLPATRRGTEYSWGSAPVLAGGGRYILCWCGATRVHAGVGGGTSCPPERPTSGAGFLQPAGFLTVTGPVPRTTPLRCSLGLVCEVHGVTGVGIRGGDRAMVTSGTCGTISPPPEGWATGIEEKRAAGDADGWLEGGWLRYGPRLSGCLLRSLGAPVATTCYNTTGNAHEGPPDFTTANNSNSAFFNRGLWGMANGAVSEDSTELGFHRWGAPTWAFAGDYSLCWCSGWAADCSKPEHFKIFIGILRLEGPAVLPLVSQFFICIRGKTCKIENFRGRMPFNSQFFIAEGECGGPVLAGAPNEGITLPSLDATTYSWGSDRITAQPGKYRLCWCTTVGFCTRPEHFEAFAAVLQVKGLLKSMYVYCTLGLPCEINGIQGEGLQNGDEVRVLTVCGSGKTPDGFEDNGKAVAYDQGTRLVIPLTRKVGRYSLCWCPAGDPAGNVRMLCSRPEDYQISLGMIEVGGPEQSSLYICYEWQPCAITFRTGTALSNGDRVLVAPPGTDCVTQGAEPVGPVVTSYGSGPPLGHPAGRRRRFPHATPEYFPFPQGGVSSPATGGGYNYSWGPDLVRVPVGIYTLCWCYSARTAGGCTTSGPFLVSAGSLRIAPYVEFKYKTRPPDPPARALDSWYAVGLALPLPFIVFLVMTSGIGRMSGFQEKNDHKVLLLGQRKSLALIAQAKAKHKHQVKEVMGTRIRADSQGLRALGLSGDSQQELPDFRATELMPDRPAMGPRRASVATLNTAISSLPEEPALGLRRQMTVDPRGAMLVFKEPSQVPQMPPLVPKNNFSEYRRSDDVLAMLGDG
uniref:Uncharacterized protein n=1 Tax=Alexandrium monilatum TaxID=311494 RepID=A0A7S4SY96_9DINO